MPRNVTKIKIFIASPGDTQDERNSASEIIQELNMINPLDNIEFELVKWETHTYSGIGEDAQEVINKQIDDDYDIFVGLMWKRFGSPTKRASSGTEEEFLRAVEIYKKRLRPIKILFYFSQTAIPPREIDADQLQKINQFRNQLKDAGVYFWDYSNIKEFEGLLRVQISKSARELLNDLVIVKPDLLKPLSDYKTEDDNEPGLFDFVERFTEEFAELETVLGRITELMTDLGEKMNKRAEEINSTDMRILKPQDVARLIDKASNDMQIFVRRMDIEMPIFKEALGSGFDNLTRAYSLYYTDWEEEAKKEVNEFDKIDELFDSMTFFRDELHSLKNKIFSLPRATKNFNKAKKDSERIIKGLISEVDSALNQANEIKKLKNGD
jgi:hypothetical protein